MSERQGFVVSDLLGQFAPAPEMVEVMLPESDLAFKFRVPTSHSEFQNFKASWVKKLRKLRSGKLGKEVIAKYGENIIPQSDVTAIQCFMLGELIIEPAAKDWTYGEWMLLARERWQVFEYITNQLDTLMSQSMLDHDEEDIETKGEFSGATECSGSE